MSWHSSKTRFPAGTYGPTTSMSSGTTATTGPGSNNEAWEVNVDPRTLVTPEELADIEAQVEKLFLHPSPPAASTYLKPSHLVKYSHGERPPETSRATSGSGSIDGNSESAASLAADTSPDEVSVKLTAFQGEPERLINDLLLSHRKDMCSDYRTEFKQMKKRIVAATAQCRLKNRPPQSHSFTVNPTDNRLITVLI